MGSVFRRIWRFAVLLTPRLCPHPHTPPQHRSLVCTFALNVIVFCHITAGCSLPDDEYLPFLSVQVKADYAQFLAHCVQTPDRLKKFFGALYFGTVSDALKHVNITTNTRPLTAIRSLIHRPHDGAPVTPRGTAGGEVPVRAAPLSRFVPWHAACIPPPPPFRPPLEGCVT